MSQDTYQRERDAAALPGYEANYAAAALAPPPPEALARRAALRRDATAGAGDTPSP